MTARHAWVIPLRLTGSLLFFLSGTTNLGAQAVPERAGSSAFDSRVLQMVSPRASFELRPWSTYEAATRVRGGIAGARQGSRDPIFEPGLATQDDGGIPFWWFVLGGAVVGAGYGAYQCIDGEEGGFGDPEASCAENITGGAALGALLVAVVGFLWWIGPLDIPSSVLLSVTRMPYPQSVGLGLSVALP